MTEILSLGKSEYLGDINYIRHIDGLVASAVSADPSEISNDAIHYHENPIISFILQGDSIETINHHRNLRSAGDIRFYRAGDLHQVKIQRFPSRNINFELEGDFLIQTGFSEETISRAIEKNPHVRLSFLRAYKEFSADDTFSDTSIQILLFNLIGTGEASRRTPAWVRALYELLNDRWNEQIGLQELAGIVNVHPVTISKYFTRYFNCTFGEYMRRLRINRSIALIKTSGLSLTEISLHCGFTDQSHFIRNFKDFTGFLPKDFRKL
jgi:AraC family transcriptional regulator